MTFEPPTLSQGALPPEQGGEPGEVSDLGFDMLNTQGMTFDDFLTTAPADVRATVYMTIAANLWANPTEVPDEQVEILGEGYFRDTNVWVEAGMQPPAPDTGQTRAVVRGKEENEELFQTRVAAEQKKQGYNPWGRQLLGEDQTFEDFMDLIAEGDPEIGKEGDPTLKGFVSGGSGWQTFKYPLAYQDRKDFMPFLSTMGAGMFGPATTFATQGKTALGLAGGSGALARAGAGVKFGRLNNAFLGMSPSAMKLRTAAGVAGKPIAATASWIRRGLGTTAGKAIFGGIAATGTGTGLALWLRDMSAPETSKEVQNTSVEAYQSALAEGDTEEADVILMAAESQGLDVEAHAVDTVTGEPFVYQDAVTGQTVTPSGVVGNGPIPIASTPALAGQAASFQPLGDIGRVGNWVDPDDVSTQRELYGDIEESYKANRLILEDTENDNTYGNQRQQRSMTGRNVLPREIPMQPDYAGSISAVTGQPITPTEANYYASMTGRTPTTPTSPTDALDRDVVGTDSVAPIFRAFDNSRYLSTLGQNQLVALQGSLIESGYLNTGTSMSGARFRAGIIDDFTMRAMGVVFGDMNRSGYQDVDAFLGDVKALNKKYGGGGGGGGGARRAPFVRQAYIAPDYDTLTQYVKGVAGQKVGRKLNESELSLMADQMKKDHKANFEVTQKARRAEYDAAGRGGDPGFAGEAIDMEASFKEFFETKYANELDRREDVEQVYGSSRNLFAGLGNAARLIGR